MIDFTKGYKSSFYCTIVNPSTWEDTGRFDILGGSVNREDDDLRQNASISVREGVVDNDQWIRIYLVASQNDNSELVPLFTGLASSPSEKYEQGVTSVDINCYSVLKAASDIYLPKGWYASAGINGVDQIASLLSVSPAPIEVEEVLEDIPIITENVISEGNETNLSMALKILDIIGWRLQIDGDGTILITRDLDTPIEYISASSNDIIENSFTRTRDWFECPNVYQVIYNDEVYEARDDDPESELSTVTRGREIWQIEDSPTLNSGQSPNDYAYEKLQEAQIRSEIVEYPRRFMPNINQDDLISIDYPELQGEFYVTSQSITLGNGIKVNEKVLRYI